MQLNAGAYCCVNRRTVAKFDGNALMKAFGQKGSGIFIAPSAIEAEIACQYQMTIIGRVDEVKERFYAISVERRVKHPVVPTVLNIARNSLFSGE